MRIRKVEIANFRGIRSLSWCPGPGINCLIGSGDSGKTTVLDAIDLCLGTRRSQSFTDADFFGGDTSQPISITLTIGDLDDALENLDAYGLYLRGFDPATCTLEDEPDAKLETVLCPRLTVGSDLEPIWDLVSDRVPGNPRGLSQADRIRIAPARIGTHADGNLAWRRGSVLSRLTGDGTAMNEALRTAGREARESFGTSADATLRPTLQKVGTVAKDLGIPLDGDARAMLDPQSVSFASGMVSLHDGNGIPLRAMGTGSVRLLAAGLQREAAAEAAPLLADEIEHGLEPHRVIRLLGSLGAKLEAPPLQVFATTHSPVVVRELAAPQLVVLRNDAGAVEAGAIPNEAEFQGILRLYPEAFLARSVLVCEGASEVGLVRGLDQHVTERGKESLFASGTMYVDAGGESKIQKIASVFQKLGYRTAVLRDADVEPRANEDAFVAAGGTVFKWRDGHALEDELFYSLPFAAVGKLLAFAIALKGDQLVEDQLRKHSGGQLGVSDVDTATRLAGTVSTDMRRALGHASRKTKNTSQAWFKSVSVMEEVSKKAVWPVFKDTDGDFKKVVAALATWMRGA